MLKRTLYLLMLSLALFLLLSLMVVSAETTAPEPMPAPIEQTVLLPLDPHGTTVQNTNDLSEPLAREQICALYRYRMPFSARPVADANGIPVAGDAYCLSAYFAFCLISSAG